MKELSKEVIELIEKESQVCFREEHKPIFKAGMRSVLTNPKITSAANLVNKEEMFEFTEWVDTNNYAQINKIGWCKINDDFEEDNQLLQTSELYTLYLKQK